MRRAHTLFSRCGCNVLGALCIAAVTNAGEIQRGAVQDPEDVAKILLAYKALVEWPGAVDLKRAVAKEKIDALRPGLRAWLAKTLLEDWVPRDVADKAIGIEHYSDGLDTLLAEYTVHGCDFRVKMTSCRVVIIIQAARLRQRDKEPSRYLMEEVVRPFLKDNARLSEYQLLAVWRIGRDHVRFDIALDATKEQDGLGPRTWSRGDLDTTKERDGLDGPSIWSHDDTVVIDYAKRSCYGIPLDRLCGVREWFSIEDELDGLKNVDAAGLIQLCASTDPYVGARLKAARAFEYLMGKEGRDNAVDPLMQAYREAKCLEVKFELTQNLATLKSRVGEDAASRIRRFLAEQAKDAEDSMLRDILTRGGREAEK